MPTPSKPSPHPTHLQAITTVSSDLVRSLLAHRLTDNADVATASADVQQALSLPPITGEDGEKRAGAQGELSKMIENAVERYQTNAGMILEVVQGMLEELKELRVDTKEYREALRVTIEALRLAEEQVERGVRHKGITETTRKYEENMERMERR